MSRPTTRGQVVGYDTLIAFFIFLLLFVWIQQIWISENNHIYSELASEQRLLIANQSVDALVASRGHPLDWNDSNVSMLGLAKSPGVLDEEKTAAFLAMNYADARSLLTGDGYDFYFELDSEVAGFDANAGVAPPADEPVTAVQRNVIYREENAHVRLKLFNP